MYKTLNRNELFEGFAVPDWATAAAYFNDSWYFEESLKQSDGCKFQCVGSDWRVCTYGEEELRGFETAVLFAPLIEQDDPLPPAPESAMFREAVTGNTLSVRVREWDNTVEVWSADRGGSVCLSAEETLQLAHDLTRMAMEIKRKEKQNA